MEDELYQMDPKQKASRFHSPSRSVANFWVQYFVTTDNEKIQIKFPNGGLPLYWILCAKQAADITPATAYLCGFCIRRSITIIRYFKSCVHHHSHHNTTSGIINLRERLIITQLVKKLLSFYGGRKYIMANCVHSFQEPVTDSLLQPYESSPQR